MSNYLTRTRFKCPFVRRSDNVIKNWEVHSCCLASATYDLRLHLFSTLAWNLLTLFKSAPLEKNESSKKYSLCTLLALGLALNANADQDNKDKKDKEKQKKVEVVDSLPVVKTDKPFSVPDAGSTAALLGLSVAFLVLAQRKAAIVK